MKRIIFVLFLALLISGCVQQEKISTEDEAKAKCISLCEQANFDLSNGPCLSDDNPEWDVEDWVCDVAHWPREDVDNKPENQCKVYREGKAKHFVEVNPNCEFIRSY